MSKYSLEIQFEPQPAAGDSLDNKTTGVVKITAHEACTCRKLVLNWSCRGHQAGESQQSREAQQILLKWEEWQPHQTYSHIFEFAPPADQGAAGSGCTWHVKPEVHLVGEFEPETTFDWLAAGDAPAAPLPAPSSPAVPELPDFMPEELAQPAASDNLETHPPADEVQEIDSDPLQPPEPAAADITHAPDFAIAFLLDDPGRAHQIDEPIAGLIEVEPDRDYEVHFLGVYLQWRERGPGDLEEGEPLLVAEFNEDLRWEAGRHYTYPFHCVVDSDPAAFSDEAENLDWFIWPEFDLTPEMNDSLDHLEIKLSLASRSADSDFWRSATLLATPVPAPKQTFGLLQLLVLGAATGGSCMALYRFDIRADFSALLANLYSGTGVGLLLGALLWLILTFRRLVPFQLAEKRLGPVGVDLGLDRTDPDLIARVKFTTLKRVQIKTVKMRFSVIELRRLAAGGDNTLRSSIRYRRFVSQSCFITLKGRERFQTELKIPFPAFLPPRQSDSSATAIAWWLQIKITTDDWFFWQRDYTITIS